MDEQIFAWTANGRRLHVDLADARAHALVAADGDLNPRSLELWRRALGCYAWELVVDVGVNYGEMLVGVDLPAGARVVGFEPNPRVRSLVARTLAEHGLDVELRAEALGATAGTTGFALDPDWSGLSSIAAPGTTGTLEVPVTTLDDVVGGAGSFCVKVDVEGFEADVLAGAQRCLARDAPWAVMLEVLHMPAGQLAGLAASYAVVMLAADGSGVLRVGADDADDVDGVVASGAVYGQDAVLLSPAAAALLR